MTIPNKNQPRVNIVDPAENALEPSKKGKSFMYLSILPSINKIITPITIQKISTTYAIYTLGIFCSELVCLLGAVELIIGVADKDEVPIVTPVFIADIPIAIEVIGIILLKNIFFI